MLTVARIISCPSVANSAMAIPASDTARIAARTLWSLLDAAPRFRVTLDMAATGKERYVAPMSDVINSPERTAASSWCSGRRLNGVAPRLRMAIAGYRIALIAYCNVGCSVIVAATVGLNE